MNMVSSKLREEFIAHITGCEPGFIGTIGLDAPKGQDEVPVYVDGTMENARNVWCCANENGLHHTGFSVKRDVKAAGVLEIATARDERPGVKFKDADLIGFPVWIIVGAKALAL